MSRLARGACAFALVAGTVAVRARGREAPASRVHASTPLRVAFEAGVDSLAESLQRLDVALGSKSDPSVRSAFRDARRMYKHQETLLEYYSPSTVSIANGPPPEEDDETPARPLGEPAAFQRIEHVAFGTIIPADSDVARARADVRLIRDAVVHFRSQTRLIAVSDLQMLDAARLELARVSALWLAGVDSDESGDAVIESASALDGVRALAAVAEKSDASSAHDERWHALDAALSSAIAQLRADSNVSTMNRLAFIAVHAARVGKQIMSARMALAPLNETLRTVWRPTAETLFDADAFDASAYTQGFALPATPDAVALGERLFHDARLSGPQTRSCASCHVPRLAFTDGLPKQPAIGGQGFVSRNTPTLLNAALQPTQFADGRAATLEAQIDVVLSSPSEMASSADIAARRLNEDSSYRRAFARVSTARRGQPVTPMLLRAVLATYVRSLVSLDSRFDLAVRGDTNALSASERRGFTLFMGKGACGTCHFAPLFNGARPPVLVAAESEIIGVPAKSDTVRATLDPDEGLGVVDIRPEHLHAFKVPSLRNVELTAPYMHNGAYASLEQVVDFYNRGGGTGIGATVPAQSLAPRPLHLTDAEQHDVVAFLKSLTGARARPNETVLHHEILVRHAITVRAAVAVASICFAAAVVSCSTSGRGSGGGTAGIEKINHVVVIYLENRSFDNMYGEFPGAEGLAQATNAAKQIGPTGEPYATLPQLAGQPWPTTLPNKPFDIADYVPATVVTHDLVHKFYHEQAQIDGGKMDRFALVSDAQGQTLGFYHTAILPVAAEAAKYTLCDRFFHSAFGSSFLNHQFLIAAVAPSFADAPATLRAVIDSNGTLVKDLPVTPDGYAVNTMYSVNSPHPKTALVTSLVPSQTNPTIGDRLSDKNISWAWYAGGWNEAIAGMPDRYFQYHHQPFVYFANYADGTPAKAEHLKDERDFVKAAGDGTLPAVSFVKPIGNNNEHAGYADIMTGERHTVELINAVRNGPNWNDTAIIITYDENGGWWDHVAPPKVDRWGPGTRIPAIVISPYAKKGFVDHTPLETTSILAFIEARWGLKPLSVHDAKANNLTSAFDFSGR